MPYLLIQSDSSLRLAFFFSVLVVMAVWEWLAPRRTLMVSKSKRWTSNLTITIINSILVRIFFPTAVIGVALYAEHNEIGLFNNNVTTYYWIAVIASVIILDFVIYLQHIMFHAVPLFWRFHRVHHVDLDIDVTTGVRFHPLEIILSLFIKFGAVVLIGAPALSVVIFQILLNTTSMFSHGNVRLPLIIDKFMRLVFVTPDMHRVHHSDIPAETNSNYGFNLSIWDRLFGTYKNQPEHGHKHMGIGVKSIRQNKYCVNLAGMLWLPFKR